MAIFEASVSPPDPIIAMYVYDIGNIRAEPHGAAEMVPRGCASFGAGIPPVEIFIEERRDIRTIRCTLEIYIL